MQEHPGAGWWAAKLWLQPRAPAVLAGGGHAWGTLCHGRWVLSTSLLWQVFMEELNLKQPDVEKVTKSCKQKLATELGPPSARRLATRKSPFAPTLRPGPPAVSSPAHPCLCWLQGAAAWGRHRVLRRCHLGGWSPRRPSWPSSCTAGSSSGSWLWTGSTGWRRPCSACGR